MLVFACASSNDPFRYRLGGSGAGWTESGSDRVLDDVRGRYPDFIAAVFDPERSGHLNLKRVRDDLEAHPVKRRNFDALNAVAIAYFELNSRAEARRGEGTYLRDSFLTAELVGVPWRAYGETEAPALRDAILDFFEDVARGEKLRSSPTAMRLAPIVSSLERKEADPARRARIRELAERLSAVASSP